MAGVEDGEFGGGGVSGLGVGFAGLGGEREGVEDVGEMVYVVFCGLCLVAGWFLVRVWDTGRCAHVAVRLVADKELQAAKVIGYDSVVSCASVDLAASALVLERMAIPPELVRRDIFFRLRLRAIENGGVVLNFDEDCKVLLLVAAPARINETQ